MFEVGPSFGIGFQVWGQYVGWAELMAIGERIDALGFERLFANDHLMPVLGDGSGPVVGPHGPVFEAWQTAVGWAGRTRRVGLGVLVSAVPYRNVGVTIRQAVTLDHASEGRAVLGLGAGWHEPEHRAFGFPYPPIRERIDRLNEASRLARGLLDGRAMGADGRWVSADGLELGLPPRQPRLPLLIGGSGERRTLRIVARDADIWNGEGDPPAIRRKVAVLAGHCAAIGRDPTSIRRTVGLPPISIRTTRAEAVRALADRLAHHAVSRTQAEAWAASSPFADTEASVRDLLASYRAAGIDEVVFDWPAPSDDETLERLAGPVRGALA